ncbi:unnamed protein product [Euphydryas editha]|uniref:Osiris 9 n=1 Tax=Euphydryas editha TaxID=104508 RepID=A0AAU9UD28_EUPED|nr:unnamed protein product [Euphydryas editha]
MKHLVIILCAVAVAYSSPIAQEDSVLRLVVGNFVNCMNSDLTLCLKEHALTAAERLGTVRKLNIFDGVTVYNDGPKEARSYEALSSDPATRSKQITERLWESTSDLLQKSNLELSLPGADDEEESRAISDVDEGRGKKKKQLKQKLKILIPLAILAKVKAVALVVFALLVIAASVFKLAVLAKIAFIAKIIAIIKALIAKKHAQEDHGWVTSHEEHVHPGGNGWEGGWSRSRNEANSLAYSAYQQ